MSKLENFPLPAGWTTDGRKRGHATGGGPVRCFDEENNEVFTMTATSTRYKVNGDELRVNARMVVVPGKAPIPWRDLTYEVLLRGIAKQDALHGPIRRSS